MVGEATVKPDYPEDYKYFMVYLIVGFFGRFGIILRLYGNF